MFGHHTIAYSLVLMSIGVAGCSSQPFAPSSLPSGVGSMASSPVSGDGVATLASARGGRPASPGIVYVTSQGLYYDTFVSAQSLPMQGRFQKLENGTTEFGPGDPGYLGGRWWVDANANGMQDEGDVFLLCPLLGPGRATP